ncbi:MAG: hypothetical protein C4332_11635 [Meiothermus sp.]
MPLSPEVIQSEFSRLFWSAVVVCTLPVLFLAGSLVASVWLLLTAEQTPATTRAFWLTLFCVATGFLGSSLSALISAADRISNGWETSNGGKWPKNAKKEDRFGSRMVGWFLVRPLLGAAMGFLVYIGVVGGYLIAVVATTKPPSPGDFNPYALGFLSLLGGLFAKTFLERLKDAFDTLFGKKD